MIPGEKVCQTCQTTLEKLTSESRKLYNKKEANVRSSTESSSAQ